MHDYTDQDLFPTAVQLIDDVGDAPNATNLNTGPQGVANRTFWLRNRLPVIKSLVLANGTTWTAPVSGTIGFGDIEGNGTGGGGAGGHAGVTSANASSGGGGGGGAAQRFKHYFTPIAGHAYACTVNGVSGGSGGVVGGAAATNGGNGGDLIWTDTTASVEVCRFKGGQGGAKGTTTTSNVNFAAALGGAIIPSTGFSVEPVVGPIAMQWTLTLLANIPGGGGYGDDGLNTIAQPGFTSLSGYPGGAAGIAGTPSTDVPPWLGGGGGGGGGAGWNGAGGVGGNGGYGASVTAGASTAGASAAVAGSGAGGGGGGGGGCAGTTPTNGSSGGAGALGGGILYWQETGTQ